MTTSRWLTDPELRKWGAPVADLARLHSAGLPILPGWAIGPEAYWEFFQQPRLRQELERHYVTAVDPAMLAGVAKALRRNVRAASLPPRLARELATYLSEFQSHLMHGSGGLTVRISGNGSVLETELANVDDLAFAVKQVYGLQFREDSLEVRKQRDAAILLPPFVVTIQYLPQIEWQGVAYVRGSDVELVTAKGIHRFDAKSGVRLGCVDEQADVPSPNLLHQVIALTRRGHFEFPDPTSFSLAVEGGRVWLTDFERQAPTSQESFETLPPLAVGLPCNPGLTSGVARLVRNQADRTNLHPGEVVVTEQLGVADFGWLAGCRAIVTQRGAAAGIEARLAKRLGVPAIIGVPHGSFAALRTGQLLTVNGSTGRLYAGDVEAVARLLPIPLSPVTSTTVLDVVTDLAGYQPRHGQGAFVSHSASLLTLIGQHPREIVRRSRIGEYQELVHDELAALAHAAAPQPIFYQLHDGASENLVGLDGVTRGFRGAQRLLADPSWLSVELAVIRSLRAQGITNLIPVMPLVRHLDEIASLRQLTGENDPWITCATPALAIGAEELIGHGTRGICVDVSLLAQLTLGIDAAGMRIGHQVDQAHPSVLQSLRFLLESCRDAGIGVLVTSGDTALHSAVADVAVRAGAYAIAVLPMERRQLRERIVRMERQLYQEYLLEMEA
jgi:phosphoenolpyruvate synthase/pyruvate phosphate dikinase